MEDQVEVEIPHKESDFRELYIYVERFGQETSFVALYL